MTDHERLMEIETRAAKATAGDWSECSAPNCKCTAIMSKNDVVAEVTRGKWGDDFPTIKLERGDGIAPIAVAVMEQITYGNVSDEQFLANRAFVAHSKADVEWLLAQLRAAMATRGNHGFEPCPCCQRQPVMTIVEGEIALDCPQKECSAEQSPFFPSADTAIASWNQYAVAARATLNPPGDSTGEVG